MTDQTPTQELDINMDDLQLVDPKNTGFTDPEFMMFHAPTLAFYNPLVDTDIPEDCVQVPMIEVNAIFNKLDGLTELCADEDGYPTIRQTTTLSEDKIRAQMQQTLTNHYEIQIKEPVVIEGVKMPPTVEEMNKFVTFLTMAQFTDEQTMDYQATDGWVKLEIEAVRRIVKEMRKWQIAYTEEYKRLQQTIDQHIADCHGIFRLMYNYKYEPNWPTEVK